MPRASTNLQFTVTHDNHISVANCKQSLHYTVTTCASSTCLFGSGRMRQMEARSTAWAFTLIVSYSASLHSGRCSVNVIEAYLILHGVEGEIVQW